MNGSALGYILRGRSVGGNCKYASSQTRVGKGGSRLEKAYGWDGHPPFTLALIMLKPQALGMRGKGPVRAANSTPIYKIAPFLRNSVRTTVFTRFFFASQLPPFLKPIQTLARNSTYTRHTRLLFCKLVSEQLDLGHCHKLREIDSCDSQPALLVNATPQAA